MAPARAMSADRRAPRCVAVAVLAVTAVTVTPASARPADEVMRDVVVSAAGSVDRAAAAVRSVGGRVTAYLPLIGAVAAEVPTRARFAPGTSVVPDRPVRATGADVAATTAAGTVQQTIGLSDGPHGAGVTVAVVDTGVADHPDLAGRIVAHINTSDSPAGDGYGHGTFVAGLIAGSGASSTGRWPGVATAARILDVQVADADGTTSLSNVLRGLQAVADRPATEGVRIVNLAMSAPTALPVHVDPLTRALDELWARGITVVVPAGNDGPDARTVTSPGTDPALLTVGALDEKGTATRGDDVVPAWSSRGPAAQGVAKPDVVAPGASVVSLRVPGSAIDAAHPTARVGEQHFRGSGSSMATAVTAGAVAAVLAARPELAPDDVKALLMGTAYRGAGLRDADAAGLGGVDAGRAMVAPLPQREPDRRPPVVGTLPDPDVAAWHAYVSAVRAGDAAAAARSWADLSPAARSWAARSWAARSWAARSWAARSWAGEDWTARSWSGWSARSWSAVDWESMEWAARSWSAGSWSAGSWSAGSWSGGSWSARSWSARSWSARSWG